MDFTINDENVSVAGETLTLREALSLRGIGQAKGIAVAVNQQIVPRSSWDSWPVKSNDQLLIITATQGG